MQRMIRFKVEVAASVGVFFLETLVANAHSCLMTKTSRKVNCISFYFLSKVDENLRLLRWLKKFYELSGPWTQPTNVICMPESQKWSVLHCVKSQFLRMFHEGVVNDWGYASNSHAIFLLELIYHLKVGGSQTNFQQFQMASTFQMDLFFLL